MKFIRVVVTHGIEEIPQVRGNEGSLSFCNQLKGAENWQQPSAIPFTLGRISESDFVNVFTDETIKLVLSEFDTAKDFVSYLDQRESLFKLDKPISVSKESDIIHLFYENYADRERSRVILSAPELSGEIVTIRKKPITALYTNHQFVSKKQADSISYFWDRLIDSFAFHALKGTSLHANWSHTSEIEPAIRVMAEPGRFDRRVLSEAFMAFYRKALPGQRGTRLFYNPPDPSVGYLFLLLPDVEKNGSTRSYRDLRNQMLQDYALIYGGIHSKLSSLVGIAAQTRNDDAPLNERFFDEGQDYVYMDCNNWAPEKIEASKTLRVEYEKNGLIAKRTMFRWVSHEFPI
jgi:hypothetical protein